MDAGEKYTSLQEQFPVIMLTLKSAKQPDYELAYGCLIDDIAGEYTRHSYVLESSFYGVSFFRKRVRIKVERIDIEEE